MLQIRHLLPLVLACFPLPAWCAPPLADVHVHYKWSQEDVTSARQALDTLVANDVVLAVVIGMPADYALRLERLAPDRVVPIWSPYRTPSDWSTWAYDKGVLERARQALESGDFRGIGELHLIGGFSPHWKSAVISGLAQLAAEFDVPVLLHTELSRPDYMEGLCRAQPKTRFLWAHAGAVLTPAQVRQVLDACPNVWVELAARDPWRFINNPITGEDGTLLPAWRTLVETYTDRFMIGSDPVWPVEKLDSWDQADTGWQEYDRFIGFHRGWMRQLAPDIEEKLRLTNALTFFRVGND
jgi:predicted TIM-barrel fold metal-dependent hydrolase